jgi:hypothetical protein
VTTDEGAKARSVFDMRIFDRTVERWRPIVDAAVANYDRWAAAEGS